MWGIKDIKDVKSLYQTMTVSINKVVFRITQIYDNGVVN